MIQSMRVSPRGDRPKLVHATPKIPRRKNGNDEVLNREQEIARINEEFWRRFCAVPRKKVVQ